MAKRPDPEPTEVPAAVCWPPQSEVLTGTSVTCSPSAHRLSVPSLPTENLQYAGFYPWRSRFIMSSRTDATLWSGPDTRDILHTLVMRGSPQALAGSMENHNYCPQPPRGQPCALTCLPTRSLKCNGQDHNHRTPSQPGGVAGTGRQSLGGPGTGASWLSGLSRGHFPSLPAPCKLLTQVGQVLHGHASRPGLRWAAAPAP